MVVKVSSIAGLYLCGEAKSTLCVMAASSMHLSLPLPASHTKAELCGSLFKNIL